ncbi:MAG: hypothetical protein PHN59_01345 [Candidatus Omnitrophica bacterium]|nr:hypothetical protein [Candidatus Omnitrophota bacterium]
MQRKIRFFLLFSLLLFIPNGIQAFDIGRGLVDSLNNLPEPRLIYPVKETAVLSGGNNLEFKWGGEYAVTVDHYDFRLYKGYNTLADNLLLKEQLPRDTNTIAVGSDKFTDGQVYTWTLRQVSLSGVKSDPSSNSFKVIKK